MKRTNKAFTLVELIIVIAVIGVLAAILIPVFSSVVDKANDKSALSDAKNSMEQVIIDGTENQAMPENIVIIVRKAQKFYVYGFNRLTDDRLYQSPGNPFRGYSDVQALIAARSWNALQGDTAPDVDTVYTDHDTYGYFYLVPYSGGVSQAASVRGIRAAIDYPEISDPTNGLMTENMGDDVHIFHGVLTDKVNVDEQTAGSETPAPTSEPTAEPTAAPSNSSQPEVEVTPAPYPVTFRLRNYDGGLLDYNVPSNDYSIWKQLMLLPGENDVPVSEIEDRINEDYRWNTGYKIIAVEKDDTTFTPLESIKVILTPEGQSGQESIEAFVYLAAVRPDNAPQDNSDLRSGRYSINISYYDVAGMVSVDGGDRFIYRDLHEGINRISVSELQAAGFWPESSTPGYHYVPVLSDHLTPIDYVEVNLINEKQLTTIYVLDVEVMLVEDI